MNMDFYTCKLRLHGNVINEVQKEGISAPEIIILRKLHGDDAVVDLKYSYTANIDATQERKRLADRYNAGLESVDKSLNVGRLFGEEYQPLLALLKGIARPGKLIKKSEMKAARKEAYQTQADAQDNNVRKLDEDAIDADDEDNIEESDPSEVAKVDKLPPAAKAPKRQAASGVI